MDKQDRESNEEKTPKKKGKFFAFFSGYGDGKGVDKDDVIVGYSLKNMFKIWGRRFRQLVAVNWYYVFGNFPVLFLLLALSGNFSEASTAPKSEIFSVIYGITSISGASPSSGALLGIHGLTEAVYANTWVTYILYGISALFFVTFGLVNTGCAYILRNMIRCEHVFIWDDFISSIKMNFRQGLILGIFDAVMCFLCGYALIQYWYNYQTMYIMFYCMLVTFFLYMFIRSYMYLILVTFKLSTVKIIKNAFILAIANFGKNLLAYLVVILVSLLVLWLSTVYIPVAIILLVMLFFSSLSFIVSYTAYAKIDKVMIEPYYKKEVPKKSLLDD